MEPNRAPGAKDDAPTAAGAAAAAAPPAGPPPAKPPPPYARGPAPQPPQQQPQQAPTQVLPAGAPYGYPPAYPGYSYYPTYPSSPAYPTYYPYTYGPPPPPKPLQPRQLRTVQGFDAAVFACYVTGASFVWSALIGAVAIAALLPTLGGSPLLRPTEAGWLAGVSIARVVVWVMFGIAAVLGAASLTRLHEGRLEFGPAHERRYRELQATAALSTVLVAGSGILTFILSDTAPSGTLAQLESLQSTVRLCALVWGASTAVAGFLFANALVKLLRGFLPPPRHRTLRVIPVILLFVPLLHAALSVSFTQMAAVDTNSWDARALLAAGEAGGLAGLAAAVPILLLVRSLRAAQERVLSGEVKSELIKRPA